jgi:GTPase SAR1 family protein
MTVYKICVCGDSNTGKTAFIRRLTCGAYIKDHIPTKTVDSHTLLLETNYGLVKLVLWDIPADSPPERLAQHFICMNGAIILENFPELGKWKSNIRDSNTECPIVSVMNKCDSLRQLSTNIKEVIPISVLNNFQLDLAINTLCRGLLGKKDLFLTRKSL